MRLLPADRFQQTLFALFLVFFAATCINPPYLQFVMMQHVPTLVVMGLLVVVSNRFVISRLSFASIILFLGFAYSGGTLSVFLRAVRYVVGAFVWSQYH